MLPPSVTQYLRKVFWAPAVKVNKQLMLGWGALESAVFDFESCAKLSEDRIRTPRAMTKTTTSFFTTISPSLSLHWNGPVVHRMRASAIRAPCRVELLVATWNIANRKE